VVKRRPNDALRLGVLPANPRHVPAAMLGREEIRHQMNPESLNT